MLMRGLKIMFIVRSMVKAVKCMFHYIFIEFLEKLLGNNEDLRTMLRIRIATHTENGQKTKGKLRRRARGNI